MAAVGAMEASEALGDVAFRCITGIDVTAYA